VTLVHLTEAGREQLAAARVGAERTARSAIEGLSGSDQRMLHRLLDGVAPEVPVRDKPRP
jgi:DNA-binding MarR family transcriptional regulator